MVLRSDRLKKHLLGCDARGGQQLEEFLSSLSIDIGTSEYGYLVVHHMIPRQEVPVETNA